MSNNGDNKLPINCPHCGQRFSVTIAKTQVLNTARVSIAVTTHEKPIKCICGGSCVLAVETVQSSWAVIPLTPEQASALDDSKIIVPPTTVRLVQ